MKPSEQKWTNGSYTVEWFDVDQVQITGPYHGEICLIDGGDFEGILAALIVSYNKGYNNGVLSGRMSMSFSETTSPVSIRKDGGG